MKNVIIIFMLSVFFASGVQGLEKAILFCEEVAEEVKDAQVYNQENVPLSVAMKVFHQRYGNDGINMVKFAYTFPSFVSDTMKEKTINEFRNFAFSTCMEGVEELGIEW